MNSWSQALIETIRQRPVKGFVVVVLFGMVRFTVTLSVYQRVLKSSAVDGLIQLRDVVDSYDPHQRLGSTAAIRDENGFQPFAMM